MKKYKYLSFVLVMSMLFLALAGCHGMTTSGQGSTNEDNLSSSAPTPGTNESADNMPNPVDVSGKTLSAQKIGSVEIEDVTPAEGGAYYETESGKYGILSPDGANDTGAIYAYCEPLGKYFEVVTTIPTDTSDPRSANTIGVVDCKGNVLVPEKYAAFDLLSDRFIKVSEVTEQTDNEDEALLYSSTRSLSITAEEGDLLYKGNWYVYDTTTGQMLSGVTGTKAYAVTAYGAYIKYRSDDGETIITKEDGTALPEHADLFENGYYAVEGAVYDSSDQKIFTYDLDEYIPIGSAGKDYFVAKKKDPSGEARYVLMNYSGQIVSGEFDNSLEVYGELVFCGNKLYDFNGNNLSGEYASVDYDALHGEYWLLEDYKSGAYALIQKDGTIVTQGTSDDTMSIYDCLITKEIDGTDYCYCVKDGDFTIKGYSFAPWIVRSPGNSNTYMLVDAETGETILEGYKRYSYEENENGMYIYASAESGIDIYLLQ